MLSLFTTSEVPPAVQGKEASEFVTSSGRSVVQECCCPLQLEPAGTWVALVRSQE